MMFEQLGLIGCGLMGGSFALALKKAGLWMLVNFRYPLMHWKHLLAMKAQKL